MLLVGGDDTSVPVDPSRSASTDMSRGDRSSAPYVVSPASVPTKAGGMVAGRSPAQEPGPLER